MLGEILKIGDKVEISFSKSKVMVTTVGKHYARAVGSRGRKWLISEDPVIPNSYYAFDAKNNVKCILYI